MSPAAADTNVRSIVDVAMNGSCAWIPYSCAARYRPSAIAAGMPTARPIASSSNTSRMTSQMTNPGCAPTARRIPNCRHRKLSEKNLIDQREDRRVGADAESERKDRHRRKERSEEHTSELQSHHDLVCRLLL